MDTILEILNKTTTFFKAKGIPNPKTDAQYILAHGLGMKCMDIYINFDRPLNAAELDTLRPMVARRAKREPLQHILGSTSFRGHEIKCDARALIPRPETECIIDLVKDRLKGVVCPRIADIGTGTGAIAIACAKEIAGSAVFAGDISKDALALAKENASLNELQESKGEGLPLAEASSSATPSSGDTPQRPEKGTLQFFEGNLLSALSAECFPLDALVSNPPYIPDADKEGLQAEVKFDPELALFGGPDGLDLVRELLRQAEGKLKPGAPILIEIASGQEKVLETEAANLQTLEWVASHKDYFGNVRFVEYKAK